MVPPPGVTGMITIDALVDRNPSAYLDFLRHLILPAVSLSLAGVAQAARLTRASMVAVAGRPFIAPALRTEEPRVVRSVETALRKAVKDQNQ